MRSELPWMEPKSPWARIGPSALALAIVGLGVGGAVRIVLAQDSAAVSTVAKAAPNIPQAVPLQIEPTPPPASEAEKAQTPSDAERQKLQQELDSLYAQRAQLDNRIADVRRRLGDRNRNRISLRSRPGDGNVYAFALPDASRLTPEQRKQYEEAMRAAQEAMRKAQDVLQKSLAEKGREFRFVVPPTPPVPALPPGAWQAQPFRFEGPGADARAREWDARMKEFDARMRQWEQEFHARMDKWQQEFERRMREQFRDENKARKGSKEEGPVIEPKEEKSEEREELEPVPTPEPSPRGTSVPRPRAYSGRDAI